MAVQSTITPEKLSIISADLARIDREIMPALQDWLARPDQALRLPAELKTLLRDTPLKEPSVNQEIMNIIGNESARNEFATPGSIVVSALSYLGSDRPIEMDNIKRLIKNWARYREIVSQAVERGMREQEPPREGDKR